ncbi:MAG: DUF362 domain-containing protein [Clostridiales bacterium]|nr:DUF362 domain-containing protein [Candidatus Blautia equi]
MKQNQILIQCGHQFKEMSMELLERCDLAGMIPDKSTRIGIKPNLVAPVDASFGSTTHPEVVAGLIEYLQGKGFSNLVMMEGSWVGDRTEESIEVCGYAALSQQYGVPFLDMQKEKGVEVPAGDLTLKICRAVQDVDFLINVPVMKGHCQTKITCALKNMKGLLPNSEKRRFHSLGLHKPIACLSQAIHQSFILVDNICGDLDSEDGGNPFEMNRVFAGLDPVLIDTYVAQLLGYEKEEIPYIVEAEKAGVGCGDLENAEILTFGEEQQITIPKNRKVVEVYDLVEEVDSCSACYAYLVPAVLKLQEEGLLDRLPGKICIGQGYRGKTGVLGVGNCTRLFEHSLSGCPPLEDEIYTYLRELTGE